MAMLRWICGAAVVVVLGVGAEWTCALELEYKVLFVDGDEIPGIPGSSGVHNPFWTNTSSDGRVTLAGSYFSPDGDGTAVWAYEPTGARLVAVEGDSPLHQELFLQYSGVIDSSGDILLSTTGPGGAALILNRYGSEEVIARDGQQAVGFPDGVVYDFGDIVGARMEGTGVICLTEWVSGPGIDDTNRLVNWVGRPDDLKVVAQSNDPVPSLPGYRIGPHTRYISFNRDGAFAVVGGGYQTESGETRDAIWAGQPGDAQLVAFEGEPAPGTSLEFDRMVNMASRINDLGNFSFITGLREPGTETSAGNGYWHGAPDDLQLIACAGMETPFGAGTTWIDVNRTVGIVESVNELGAFSGSYTDTEGVVHEGLFTVDLNDPAKMRMVVETGDLAHGVAGERTYTFLAPFGINQYGDILYGAKISGLAHWSAYHGIWLVPAGGEPIRIGMDGGNIDMDPGPAMEWRRVQSWSYAPQSFESRSFVFAPGFTDGSWATMQFQIVPEPGMIALLAGLCGVAAVLIRRPRR